MNRRQWREADLSAYLDGRLSLEKEAALKASLAQDAELRLKIEQLQQVKSLIGALPLRETPRNYILTPAMVAESEPNRAQATRSSQWPSLALMRLATAFTTIAFVVTMGLNFLSSWSMGSMTMMPNSAPGPQMRSITDTTSNGTFSQPVEQSEDEVAAISKNQSVTIAAVQPESDVSDSAEGQEALSVVGTVVVEELPYGVQSPGAFGEGGGVGGGEAIPTSEEKLEENTEMEKLVIPPEEPAPKQITESRETEDTDTGPPPPPEVAQDEEVMAAMAEGSEGEIIQTEADFITGEPLPEAPIPSPELPEPRATIHWLPWVSGILGVLAITLGSITWWKSRHEI